MPDYKVTVAGLPTGQQYVELTTDPQQPPIQLQTGQSVTLDGEAFSQIDPTLLSNGTLTYTEILDNSGQVTTQGAAVTLTSTPVAAATYDVPTTAATSTSPFGYTTAAQADAIVTAVNQLITQYNQLQADVAALNTALSGTGKALA